MPRGDIEIPRDALLDNLSDDDSSNPDQPMGSPNRHENENPPENIGDGQGNGGGPPPANNEAPAPPHPNATAGTLQAGGNTRQIVNQMIAHRKLDENAQQDLHRYSKASALEREIMEFSLNLELRQEILKVANAVASSAIHSDLQINAKTYAAAVFFAPNLTYYRGPRSGSRAGMLQGLVLKALRANHVAHLPAQADKAGADKLLSLIGTHFTDYRSSTKSILEKRKLGEPEMDIGSLVARATKNAGLKITAKHYGRFAFLSRQMDAYKARPNAVENDSRNYWDWVDQALKNLRQEIGADQKAIDRYFRKVIAADEAKWSRAVGELYEDVALEDWQRAVQREAELLPNK